MVKTRTAKAINTPPAINTSPPIVTPPQTPVVLAQPTTCPKCGSADREPYRKIRRHPYAGTTPDGRPFQQVVWRRTKCLACGQVRDDRSFE